MNLSKLKPAKRRGLSSIIGALFFIVLMVATFTALLAAFSYQNDLIDTQRTVADREVAKARENFFVISDIDSSNNKLFVTIKNQGTNPVEIANLWVIEKEASYEAKNYTLNSVPPLNFEDVIIPIATSKNITSNLIPLDPLRDYTVKVVSRLGTVVSVDVPDNTTPPGPPGQQGDPGLACWDLNNNGIFDYTPSPPGDPNDEDTNDDNVSDAYDCLGNTPGPAGPPGKDGESGVVRVLEDDLFSKPGLFLTFPSPFGDTGGTKSVNRGLWGVTVANPTDQNMNVSKIVITVLSPRSNPVDTFFDPAAPDNCNPVNVPVASPPNITWTCTSQNQLTWKNTTSQGSVIPPRSAVSFLALANPGDTQSGGILEASPVVVSAFTSLGQFGKTAYITSLKDGDAPMVNVYLSTVMDSGLASNMRASAIDLANYTANDFIVTMADLNMNDASTYILKDSRLIINLPKNFTSVTTYPNSNFNITTTNNIDGSTQIVGKLLNNLGTNTASPGEAKSIKFSAVTPSVTKTKLYVIYVLADGDTMPGTFPEGPLSEIVVSVKP